MIAYAVAGAVAIVTAAVGAYATDVGPWYRALDKPVWTPPDWLFGPAWTLIFALTVWAAGTFWYAVPEDQRMTIVVLPFAVNVVLNMAWSVLFFYLIRPAWAAVEVVALWISTALLVILASNHSTLAAGLLGIYLGWITFASTLNLSIVRRNR